jgi:hypothetical protein
VPRTCDNASAFIFHTSLQAIPHRRSHPVILIRVHYFLGVNVREMRGYNKWLGQAFEFLSAISFTFRPFIIGFYPFFAKLVDGCIHKKASSMGAGPLMVMLTDVFGSQRSNPLYNFFASSTVAMLTPLLPTLP